MSAAAQTAPLTPSDIPAGTGVNFAAKRSEEIQYWLLRLPKDIEYSELEGVKLTVPSSGNTTQVNVKGMALICSESPQAQVAPLYYDNEEEKWILAPAFDKHLQLSAQLPTDIPAPSSLRFPEPQQPTGSWAHMAKPTAYGLHSKSEVAAANREAGKKRRKPTTPPATPSQHPPLESKTPATTKSGKKKRRASADGA